MLDVDVFTRLSQQLIAHFGVKAQLLDADKEIEIVGIFDRAYIETLDTENIQVLFTVTSGSLPINVRGCLLRLDKQTYRVAQVQPDGVGVITLILEDIT